MMGASDLGDKRSSNWQLMLPYSGWTTKIRSLHWDKRLGSTNELTRASSWDDLSGQVQIHLKRK